MILCHKILDTKIANCKNGSMAAIKATATDKLSFQMEMLKNFFITNLFLSKPYSKYHANIYLVSHFLPICQ